MVGASSSKIGEAAPSTNKLRQNMSSYLVKGGTAQAIDSISQHKPQSFLNANNKSAGTTPNAEASAAWRDKNQSLYLRKKSGIKAGSREKLPGISLH